MPDSPQPALTGPMLEAVLSGMTQGIVVLSHMADAQAADFQVVYANEAASEQLKIKTGEDALPLTRQFPDLRGSRQLSRWIGLFDDDEQRKSDFDMTDADALWRQAAARRSGDWLVLSLPALHSPQEQDRHPELIHYWKQIINRIPDAVLIIDYTVDRIVYANRGLADVVGYTAAEMHSFGESYMEVVSRIAHPEDLPILAARRKKLVNAKDGEVIEDHVRFMQKEGGDRWLNMRGIVLDRTVEGEARHILTIATDVTPLKDAEEKVRQSEEKLRRLNDDLEKIVNERTAKLRESEARLNEAQRMAKVGYWELDPESGKVHWSEEAYRIHELDPSLPDVDLDTILSLYPEAEKIRADLGKAFSQGKPFVVDSYIRLPDGRKKYIYAAGRLMKGESGIRQQLLHGTVMDITERKQAELAREESQKMLQVITDEAPALIAYIDKDEKYRFLNRAYDEVFGINHKDFVGREVRKLIGEENYKIVEPYIAKALSGKKTAFENAITLPDGTPQDRRVELIPQFSESGEVIGVIAMVVDLTEIKKAQREAEENARRFEFLIDNLPHDVYESDAEGHILLTNHYWRDLTGFTEEETFDFGWKKAIHPDDLGPMVEAITKGLSTGEEVKTEFRIRRADGAYRWHASLARAMKDEDGNILRWIGSAYDIHDNKMLNEKLAESARRFQFMVDNLLLTIYEADTEGQITFINKYWQDYTGLSEAETLGEGYMQAIHPDDLAENLDTVAKALKEGGKYYTEYRLRRADGVYRWYASRANPLKDENGRILRWMGSLHDIHDGKTLNEKLEESARRFEFLIDNLPLSVYEADAHGQINLSNKYWRKYTGLTDEETRGLGWMKAIHPEDLQATMEAVTSAIKAQEEFSTEFRIKRADGEYRWHASQARTMKDDQGNVIRWMGASFDIHDRKVLADGLERQVAKHTRALKEANEELKRSNMELEQFAYIASHDLKEPIRTVGSFTQLLVMKYKEKLGSEGEEYIKFILDGTHRMQALISDLLNYSRVGRGEIQKEKVDLNEVLDVVRQSLAEKIKETGATIEAEDLPTIQGLPTSLQQLFQNLVGNGIKFHRKDTPPVVRVSAEQKNGKWHFKVQDNGIGIPEKHQERVFVIFQRLHGREEYEGTGIGLAVCKKIVEMHGGKIKLESEEGKGTTFEFTLG